MQEHAKAGIPISQENYTTVFISFKELSPRRTTYPELFERLSSGELRQATEKIQAFPYGSECYKKAKRTYLPFFSPHCQTRGLKKIDTIQHSGVFCFDIDKKDNPALDFEKLKEIFRREHSVLGYFTSVGGGLKVFVRVRSKLESHQRDYFLVLGWIEKLSGASFDESQGRLSQTCFLSYDPDAYYNPRAKTLSLEGKTPKRETAAKAIKKHQIQALRDEASLIRIFYQLERKGRSITETYDEWIKLGFALINTLGAEKAREWFHRFSSLDRCYSCEEAEEKYESLQKSSLSYRGKGKLSIAAILYMAKQKGCIEERKPTSPFNLNHAHPLQFAMPSRYSSTQVLQAKIMYTLVWLENNPQSTHKQGSYVRINQSFIAGIVGSSQQSISNNIRKLKEAGFIELIQPQIGEGDSSYFAKTTKKYY